MMFKVVTIGMFLCFVSSSLGKTHTTKELSEFYYQGEKALQNHQPRLAIVYFTAVLKAKIFNDIGKVTLNWYLYHAYLMLGDENTANEYLFVFLVMCDNLKDEFTSDFKKHFNVQEKVTVGTNMLNIGWMKRSSSFGRTRGYPFFLDNMETLGLVKEYLPFCGNVKKIKNISYISLDKHLFKVKVRCLNNRRENYYFSHE